MRQTCSYRGESGPRDSILCVSVSVADGARPKSGAANRIPPFVAIGTLGLALATVMLAWTTRRVSNATAQDVSAQWRPAIAPGEEAEVAYFASQQEVSVWVRNVGRGAAYYVDPALALEKVYIPAARSIQGELRNFAVLPAGESLELIFTDIEKRPGNCEIVADYEDLAGNRFSTRFEILDFPVWGNGVTVQKLVMERVTLSSGTDLIPWKEPPSLWWRIKAHMRQAWRERKRSRRQSGEADSGDA